MNYFVVWHERVKMTGGVQGLKENCSIHGTMEQAEEAYAEVHEAMLSERGKMPLVPLNTEGAVNDIHILVPVKSRRVGGGYPLILRAGEQERG